MFVIGDVHGCLKTLQALVEKLPAKDPKEVCLVGDLIDRGPDCVGTVDWVRSQGFYCVRGNHEDMMLDHFRHGASSCRYERWGGGSAWENNGANPEAGWFEHHRDWFASLPFFIDFVDEVKNGRHLFVSHGAPVRWDDGNGRVDWHPFDLMWNRWPSQYDPQRYFVFGHTPVKQAVLTSQYANVDTGCVHKYTGIRSWGKLTALQFPELVLWEQEYVDAPNPKLRVETVKSRPL